MSKRIEMVGLSFGKLTVISKSHNAKNGKAMWNCICECGNQTVVRGDHLRCSKITSCGCAGVNAYGIVNLDSHSPMVSTYMNMIYRCEDPNNVSFKHYGGRGLTVCTEWHDFKNFEKWMLDNNWHKGLEIDRIDNNKGYAPDNCRVVDRKTNLRNKRDNTSVLFQGKYMTIADIAETCGLKYDTVYCRYYRGIRGDALGLPPKFVKRWHKN